MISLLSQRDVQIAPAGITDASFWSQAESRIYTALRQYSERAQSSGYQRRLFTEDVAGGFAFIDLLRMRYDVAIMNPPFGDPVPSTKSHIVQHYREGAGELYSAFVIRATQLLTKGGTIGVLSSRTFLFKTEWSRWRQFIRECGMQVLAYADLGNGVLDGALVEAAATVLGSTQGFRTEGVFLNVLSATDKAAAIQSVVASQCIGANAFCRSINDFTRISGEPWVYSIPNRIIDHYARKTIGDVFGSARSGICSGDDFRFLRLFWEVQTSAIGRRGFIPFSKGGECLPLVDPVHLLLDWRAQGRDVRLWPGARVQGVDCFFRNGISYPLRTFSALAARFVPGGTITSNLSQFIPLDTENESSWAIACLHSRYFQANIEMLIGTGDATTSGGTARSFTASAVSAVPYNEKWEDCREVVVPAVLEMFGYSVELQALNETVPWFSGLGLSHSASDIYLDRWRKEWGAKLRILDLAKRIQEYFNADEEASISKWIESLIGPSLWLYGEKEEFGQVLDQIEATPEELLQLARASQCEIGPHITRKCFVVDRQIEVLAHIQKLSPVSIMQMLSEANPSKGYSKQLAIDLLSVAVGAAIGHYKSPDVFFERIEERFKQPFEIIPYRPPACGGEESSILVDDLGHRMDLDNAIREKLGHAWGQFGETVYRTACDEGGLERMPGFGSGNIFGKSISNSSRRAVARRQSTGKSPQYRLPTRYGSTTID